MEAQDSNIKDFFHILWKHRKFVILFVLIVAIITAGISLILPKWYKATVVILPEQSEGGDMGGLAANAYLMGFGNIFGGNDNQMRLLALFKSRSLLLALNDQFDFESRYNTKGLDKTLQKLRSNIYISAMEENQIAFSILSRDQEQVANMANFASNFVDDLNIHLTINRAKFNREFVREQLLLMEDSLRKATVEFTSFKEKNNIISLPDQVSSAILQAAEIQATIKESEIEYGLKKDLYDETSLELITLKSRINLLKQQYDEFYAVNVESLFLDMDAIPQLEKEYAEKQWKVEYYKQMLEFLGPQYEKAKIEEAKDVPTFHVLDKAMRPDRRDKPRRAVMVLTYSFAAFLFSIIYIIIKERF
ncbi:MAG: hypothetical protein JW794_00665 [Candidatus Cloacimonetes bacterium]|nr:hypothetical protein [Candidatus Cloacimonadota bacterium]